jgi:predicted DNA-binding protein (UPF0251 family)
VSEGDAVLIGFDLLEIETGNVFETEELEVSRHTLWRALQKSLPD